MCIQLKTVRICRVGSHNHIIVRRFYHIRQRVNFTLPLYRETVKFRNKRESQKIQVLYLFQAFVHQIAEHLSHHQGDSTDQQEGADDPHRVDSAGPSRHCWQMQVARLNAGRMVGQVNFLSPRKFYSYSNAQQKCASCFF